VLSLVLAEQGTLHYLCDFPRWNWLDSTGFVEEVTLALQGQLAVSMINIIL
jgi:hypothetical protein